MYGRKHSQDPDPDPDPSFHVIPAYPKIWYCHLPI